MISAIDVDLTSEEDRKRAYDELEESAANFYRDNDCDVEGKSAGRFTFKRPNGDKSVACAFMPVANLKEEQTGTVIDAAVGYLSGFLGIEPRFDDYTRINNEFKEQIK